MVQNQSKPSPEPKPSNTSSMVPEENKGSLLDSLLSEADLALKQLRALRSSQKASQPSQAADL